MPSISKQLLFGHLLIIASFQFVLSVPAAHAEEAVEKSLDPSKVLAYQGDITLSQTEIDAAFSKLAPDDRLSFIRDGGKVDQLIRVLLRRKAIAADAAKAGFDSDPVVAARVRLEAEKELAEAWLQQLIQQAPQADYEALAREDYLANPDSYRSPEILDVSHILIGTDDRSPAEARKLVESLEDRLQKDPSEFDQLVMEYSDDPAKQNNGGRYRDMKHGMMAAPFEQAAFRLAAPGAISEPVQTDYGWHIIRLNAREGNELRDFSEVEDEAVARAQLAYYESYRENYLRRVLSAPVVVPDGAVEIMARRHFGENLELAPNLQR
jgi:peptidyl-prolyl cis-trans isomerase C